VALLEQESAQAPHQYRVKVAVLAMLGFAILGLVFAEQYAERWRRQDAIESGT